MQLVEYTNKHNIDDILNQADQLCKAFDSGSNCYDYLKEKLTNTNCKTYNLMDSQYNVHGIAIIEILDTLYGNLILHTHLESDEAKLADLMVPNIKGHVLELISFDLILHIGTHLFTTD